MRFRTMWRRSSPTGESVRPIAMSSGSQQVDIWLGLFRNGRLTDSIIVRPLVTGDILFEGDVGMVVFRS